MKEDQEKKEEEEKKAIADSSGEEGKTEIATEEAKKIVSALTDDVNSNKDEDTSKDIVKRAAQAVGSLSDSEFSISFNPDVFQPQVKHAEKDVRDFLFPELRCLILVSIILGGSSQEGEESCP
jgi:protein TIF31